MIKYFCDKCDRELESCDIFVLSVTPPEVRSWNDNALTGECILCRECLEKFQYWVLVTNNDEEVKRAEQTEPSKTHDLRTETHACVKDKKKPCADCEYHDWRIDDHIGYISVCNGIGKCPYNIEETITSEPSADVGLPGVNCPGR